MYACCQFSVHQDTFCSLELAEFAFESPVSYQCSVFCISLTSFIESGVPHCLNFCYQRRLFSSMRRMENGKCNQLFSTAYLAASNKPYFDAGKQNSFAHLQQHRIPSDVSLRLQKTAQILTWSLITVAPVTPACALLK